MSKETVKRDKGIVALSILALLVPAMMYQGYVTTVLWKWFMVSYFGLKELSIPVAIGASLLVSHHRLTTKDPEMSNYDEPFKVMGVFFTKVFVQPSVVLGIGWLVTRFM